MFRALTVIAITLLVSEARARGMARRASSIRPVLSPWYVLLALLALASWPGA